MGLPSNKLQGYVLRKLLRRSIVKIQTLKGNITSPMGDASYMGIIDGIIETYKGTFLDVTGKREEIFKVIAEERDRFGITLSRGLKLVESYKGNQLTGLNAFTLYQSYGFPPDLTYELFLKKSVKIDKEKYYRDYSEAFKLTKVIKETFSRYI
jgi:alanyl-tRNA synthetase